DFHHFSGLDGDEFPSFPGHIYFVNLALLQFKNGAPGFPAVAPVPSNRGQELAAKLELGVTASDERYPLLASAGLVVYSVQHGLRCSLGFHLRPSLAQSSAQTNTIIESDGHVARNLV